MPEIQASYGSSASKSGSTLRMWQQRAGLPFPEVRALAAVLPGHGAHVRRDQLEAVALDQRVSCLVRLTEEELRVELDDRDVEAELRDHVDEHRRLLLPRTGQAELVAKLAVCPAEDVLRLHRLDVRKLQ